MAVRKSALAMTVVEQNTFIYVMNKLISAPGDPNSYGDMVGFHRDMSNNMHSMNAVGTQRFLPWHRAYLRKIELMGELIDPAFFIPYWNWSLGVPAWLVPFLPTVKVVGANITVTRARIVPPPALPTVAQVNAVLANATYTTFTTALESGPHNSVHGWVGGTMGSITTAPADPLFWMHHAMIDRVWSLWQVTRPGLNPALVAPNDRMDPWQDLEPSLRSIATLGYSYL